MKPQQQQRQRQKKSPVNNDNFSSTTGLPLKLIFSGVGVIALLLVVQSIFASLFSGSSKLNLKEAELNPSADWQQEAQALQPRFGLDDLTVSQEQVTIILRDNGYEDGDHVTLFVNGKAYTESTFLTNAGQSVVVPLNLGANFVQITGDLDGGGGVTLAAGVSNQQNMSSSPMPVGSTAAFYIIRR